MNISVIVTTYNHPRWLEKVVWAFEVQTHRQFELVIADDGSDENTRRMIERLREDTGLTIHHVWHEDKGFRKCEILNKAIAASSHDYLVFIDGDCVPRRDFLETHLRLAEKGCFLSGGIVRLPIDISQQLSKDAIQDGRALEPAWLRSQGMRNTKKFRLLTARSQLGAVLDALTTTRATFNGHNASAWREDVLRVNGFDERMKYGGLDRELGERLVNAGLYGKQIRHRAACIHLDHGRGYVNNDDKSRNRTIWNQTVASRRAWTEHGVSHHLVDAPPSSPNSAQVADVAMAAQE